MASSHPQAYLSASEVIAASPPLDSAMLDLPDPGGDALLLVERNGLGRIAALTTGDFTHVVAGAGIEHWDAPFWRAGGTLLEEELTELPPGPLDLPLALELLADAPYGVREALIDAALDGPVALIEEDEERRAAWIAWLTAVLPEPPTFATFATQPLDVRVCATTPEHAAAFPDAIDTSITGTAQPSRFATIATAVAGREPSALGGEPDPIALAVKGGATDLLTPDDLPRALELIAAFAQRGEVARAARAAAGLGAVATSLVIAEPAPVELEVVVERVPEPPDAEVVEAEVVAWPTIEAEAVEDAEVIEPELVETLREDTFGGGLPLHDLEEAVEPHPAESGRSLEELMAAFTADPLEEPEEEAPPADEVLDEQELGMSLSELEATLEVEEEVGMSLEEFEASLKRERES